jgi:phosphatidate cytidylyltransferase
MKRILTAVVLIPLVLLLIFKAPVWAMSLALAFVALAATHEYLNIVQGHGIEPFRAVTMLIVFLFFLPGILPNLSVPQSQILFWAKFLIVLLGPILFLSIALSRETLAGALPAAAASYIALPYIAVSLWSAAIPIWYFPFGAILVFYMLIVVWGGDIFAYYVGKNFGRNKLAPRISPGKTWEGTAASIVGAALLGSLILLHLPAIYNALVRLHLMQSASVFGGTPAFKTPTFFTAVWVSVVINAAAQLGDLVESMIKRGANLKDSGTILPGHGGVLDRIDALLFAAPVSVLTFVISGLHHIV